ncbi:MAG TPA: NAD-dependent epimerase/dehydratase family protein [Thermomicrobiales bacterium]|nr:NAD-dependent epimerase/dehydratase family protein [Thermomicrobiales bacterium]
MNADRAAAPVTGRILITGGTGFVGAAIRAALRDRPARLLVRDWRDVARLAGPNVEVVAGDITRPDTLAAACDGCEAVIHLVAIIAEQKGATFDEVIRQGTVNVADAARAAGARRLLHMSALGTRNDPRFPYFEAKWQAEQAVMGSGIPWTIFRPSIIFGPGDEFINTLARLVKAAPAIPVAGNGRNAFQPVAVDDVAAAFVHALDDPATAGHIYDIGGGKIYTYDQLLDAIARKLGVRKRKVHLPISAIRAAVALSRPLPKALRPPVTDAQLKMLAIDNCSNQSATAELAGHPPLALEDGIDYIVAGKGV